MAENRVGKRNKRARMVVPVSFFLSQQRGFESSFHAAKRGADLITAK